MECHDHHLLKRLAIELAAIRQTLEVEAKHQWKKKYGKGEVRPDKPKKPPIHWLPTKQQWADIFTKKMTAAAWWEVIARAVMKFPLCVQNEQNRAADPGPV